MGTATDVQLRPTSAYNSAWFVDDWTKIDEAMHYHSITSDDGEKAIASGANGDALEWQWWNTGDIAALTDGEISDITLYTLWDDVSNFKPTDGNIAIAGVDETASTFDANDFTVNTSLWGRRTWRRSDALDSAIANMRIGLKSANLQPPNEITYIGCAYIDVIRTVDCFILRPTNTITAWNVGTHADVNDPIISGGQANRNHKYCRPQEKADSLKFMELGCHDIPSVSNASLESIRLYCDGGDNEKCKVRVNNVWSSELAWDGTENGLRYKDFTYTDDISSGITNIGLAIQAPTLGNGDEGQQVYATYLQVNYAPSASEVDVDAITIDFDLQDVTTELFTDVDSITIDFDLKDVAVDLVSELDAITIDFDLQDVTTELLTDVEPITIDFDLQDVAAGRSVLLSPMTIDFDLKDVTVALISPLDAITIDFDLQDVTTELFTDVDSITIDFDLKDVGTAISTLISPYVIDFNLQDVDTILPDVMLRTPVAIQSLDISFKCIQSLELNITRKEP
jgi:hypothetical protein